MKKKLAAAAVTATLVGGGIGGAVLVPSMAAAQTEEDEAEAPEGSVSLADVLGTLVENGVITQEQADAVEAAIQEARPFHRGNGFRMGFSLGTAAEVIGIDSVELREALADGQSLADVAEANGSSGQAVIDALVEESDARVDQKVEDGRIDAAEADEIKAERAERIEAAVNGEAEFARNGFGRGPRFGPPADDGGGADDGTDTDTGVDA